MTKDVYPQYDIGDFTYGVPDIAEGAISGKLTIGKFCSIAVGSKILLGGVHHCEFVTTSPLPMFRNFRSSRLSNRPWTTTNGNVQIGHDVWLGTDSLILSGVSIGTGAVIAARSVVTRSIPPYAIAAGSPARVVRYRFDPESIRFLLEIKWWEWGEERIASMLEILLSSEGVQALRDGAAVPQRTETVA